jgi:CDP-6-deoxy-D-xylo-4-hexulose-3-dehydrase
MSTIEGGMACTSDPELGEMLRIVRANGWDRNLSPAQQEKWRKRHGVKTEVDARYSFYDLGYNLRPTEITGFIGLQQLKSVGETFRQREAIYERLDGAVKRNADLLSVERSHIGLLSNFAFPVVAKDAATRARYAARLAEAGVEIRPLIAGNMQRQPFYKKYAKRLFATPDADFLHDCALYFGNYPELSDEDLTTLEHCLLR